MHVHSAHLFAGSPNSMIPPNPDEVVIVGSCSSNEDSSDPDDPISRGARRAAVCAAQLSIEHRPLQQSSTIADFFRPISSAAYWRQLDIAAQPDIMDLRSVVAVPAADIVTEGDNDEYDSDSSKNSPKRRRHGYEIDDFVVDSSQSDGSQ
jgi:hypothetical protein